MKSLRIDEANVYLKQIGMEIGYWNRIKGLPTHAELHWVCHYAPKEARVLFTYAQRVAGWLPKGDWKILQVDYSTGFFPVDAYFTGRLLFGSQKAHEFNDAIADSRTFLFEFCDDKELNEKQELQLANGIFAFLLFENHCYIVSSASDQGRMLGIHDGFVYFYSRSEDDVFGARSLVKSLNLKTVAHPAWVSKIMGDSQDEFWSSPCAPRTL